MTPLASHLSAFLREYLPRDRGASPHTVEIYAQGLSLLIRFAASRLAKAPSDLTLEEIDADLVLAYLEDTEVRRQASVRTRNARLAAIKTFFRFLEYRLPANLEQARQIRAIPLKNANEALISWLTRPEIRALLNAPDPRTRYGIRDRAMLYLAYAAGLRVSELTGLLLTDYDRRDPASIRVNGKGRRERILPLWKETRRVLDAWIRLRNQGGDAALFHNRSDRAMTRAGFEYILAKHAARAARAEPSIAEKRVTPHVLRHSCAMHTLQATGDVRKVSLWLGHASIQSTEIYLRADPTEKLKMLAGAELPTLRPGRFRAPDKLLALLSKRQSP
jgi:site-specific recombinase XerD